MIKNTIISEFNETFSFIRNKFEIIELLENSEKIDYDKINDLKLPSDDFNIVWHPGVYLFIGNKRVYRVGVSLRNSRNRVMQHIGDGTTGGGHCVCDIDKFDDRSILLFNIKNPEDRFWLLALELFFEEKFTPLIKARRKG